jgi:hypothetical protein
VLLLELTTQLRLVLVVLRLQPVRLRHLLREGIQYLVQLLLLVVAVLVLDGVALEYGVTD